MNQDRREFLGVGLATTALGLGCFCSGLNEAVASTNLDAKPVLTHDSLNRFLLALAATKRQDSAKEFGAIIVLCEPTNARDGVLQWLEERFLVTESQKKLIKSLTMDELGKIKEVAHLAGQEYLATFKFITPAKGAKKPEGSRVQIHKDAKVEAKKRKARVEIHCDPTGGG